MREIGWKSVVIAITMAACSEHGGGHADGTTQDAASQLPGSTPIPAVAGDAVYVVNGGDSSISVLDPAGTLLGTIALRNVTFPHHIYLNADKTRLAVAVPGHDLSGGHSMPSPAPGGEHGGGHGGTAPATGAVLILDADTGATVKARRLDAPNHNAIFSPNGAEIWTAQLVDPGTVLVLDAASLETKQTIPVGRVPAEVTFTSDGKYAFVANGTSNDVTVIDTATKSVVKTIPVDEEPVGAWPGADGTMYVDCEVSKTVKAIDPKTLEVLRTYNLGFTPGIAAVPPARPDELWVTNTDAGKIVFDKTVPDGTITDLATAAGAHALAFTPDGKVAFVTNQLAATVSVVDAATRTVKATLPVGNKPNGIVYRKR